MLGFRASRQICKLGDDASTKRLNGRSFVFACDTTIVEARQEMSTAVYRYLLCVAKDESQERCSLTLSVPCTYFISSTSSNPFLSYAQERSIVSSRFSLKRKQVLLWMNVQKSNSRILLSLSLVLCTPSYNRPVGEFNLKVLKVRLHTVLPTDHFHRLVCGITFLKECENCLVGGYCVTDL